MIRQIPSVAVAAERQAGGSPSFSPLVFIAAEVIVAAVVELGGARRGMVCHHLRVFQRAGRF